MIITLLIVIISSNECNIENCFECDGDTSCKRCIDGYSYLISYETYSYQCVKCHSSCKQCDDKTDGDCTECYDGFYLYKRGAFNDFGTCKQCSEDGLCSQCEQEDPYLCTDCIKNYFLDKSVDPPTCKPCDPSCETCSGTEATQCITCRDGYIKSGDLCKSCGDNCKKCKNENQCETCQEHYYTDSSFKCHECHESCKNCHGPTLNDCDDCYDGYYNGNGLCRACDDNCKTCAAFRNYCTTCEDGKYLEKEKHICLSCDPLCKTCENSNDCLTCADGYYKADNKNLCQKCDPTYHCLTCGFSSYLRSQYCTSCVQGYYPSPYYGFSEGFKCEYSNIEGCSNATDFEQCESCIDGYYLKDKRCHKCDGLCQICSDSNHCSSCHKGAYLTESSTCAKCSDNCLECNSKSDCTKCEDKYFSLNGFCKRCNESCSVCKDDSNACVECADGYYFNQFKRCVKCRDNCEKCQNITHCSECKSEFYIAEDGSCSPCAEVCFECNGPTEDDCLDCDPGYYLSPSFKKCFKCNEACLECTGPNDYECSKCAPGYFMNYDVDISSDKKGDRCTKCEYGCKTCESAVDCTECQDGYYLDNANCEHCIAGCKKCSSGGQQCTECFDGYYVSSTDGKLVNCSACPTDCKSCSRNDSGQLICNKCYDGYYPKDNKCTKCRSPCATCSSENKCKTCIKGHLFDGISSCDAECSKSCATCNLKADICTSCKDGYILNGTVCLKCSDGCKTCEIEGEVSSCTSCLDGFYLDNEQCKKCSDECETCYDSSSYCYTCVEGFYKSYQYDDLSGDCTLCNETEPHCSHCTSDCTEISRCVFSCTRCDDGFFFKDGECKACHKTCKTCDGTSELNCLSCADEYFLGNDGKCEKCDDSCLTCSKSSKECTSCKSNQYLSGGQCFNCNSACVECKDQNTCTKCPQYQFLHDGKCISSCLQLGEGWGGNINFECVKCSLDNCLKYDDGCQCTQCNEGYFIVTDEITTVEVCVPCQLENCKACNGAEKNDCTECNDGHTLQTDPNTNNKFCQKMCDEGYYFDDNNKCQKCNSPCKICSGKDGSICSQCEDGYYLSNSTCRFFPSDCEQNKHCENVNEGDKPVHVTIDITRFDSFKSDKSGGALHIVNCGISGNDISFSNCTSEKGGGGAIYVFNNKELENPITLKKMTFSSCKATFGGAVYIYSIDEKSLVTIESCNFIKNEILNTNDSGNNLKGGSAIYLTVKKGIVRDSSFIGKNGLSSGMIKVTEDFDITPEKEHLKLLNKINDIKSISIIRCSFEIVDNSSLTYFVEKQNLDSNNNFGWLVKNTIKSNFYSNAKLKEFNNKFIYFDVKKKENKYLSANTLMIIFSFMMIVIISTLIIKTKKFSIEEQENKISIDSFNE
ncbi:hypothetical protein M9Y10_020450 [Tritrichomonas musculus]|uniref:TNFR-Cys domain-containing protein n=1 Tax=Tritrichomonas musculus TaxID=1915356 RepID=A0ABR2HHC9_9EUKA